jgi:hypothetical protein
MRSNNSGCLTGIVAGFSRIMLLMFWFARPVAMETTFGTFIVPCLGFMILPVTTMVYVWLYWSTASHAIQGLDWVWLGLAVVLDIASIGAAGAANRNRIPQGYPGSSAGTELAAAPAAPDQPTQSKPQ